jgi:protein-tyrosine phosphatase
VIDLHSHALPGIDDGPDDMHGSIALARAAAETGTKTLVTTPHIDRWWNVDPASVAGRVAELRATVADEGIELDVRAGGEIALTRLVDLDDHELDAVALGGGRHVLLEAPLTPGAGDFDRLILAVLSRRPVLLAHPERCPAFLREPERYERLLEAGALGQLTAGSFVGQFGGTIRATALRWLDRGWVHVVASDAHDAYRRPPGLRAALDRAGLGDELATWLTEAVPTAILESQPIPRRPVEALSPRA